jgi:two-component system chemotaxis response regulator CheB
MLGVILTGTGSDGAEGMKAIKSLGGNTIAEDASTSIALGMPKVAIEMVPLLA